VEEVRGSDDSPAHGNGGEAEKEDEEFLVSITLEDLVSEDEDDEDDDDEIVVSVV
jgi:hypothetical protein